MLQPHLPGSEARRFVLPHVELAGCFYGPEEGLPVIALHGWLDNAMSFVRIAPQLPGVRLLLLDLPGHGLSGHYPPGAGYPLWDYARDVLMVADQLGWSRFALLGHSLGAVIASMLAAAMPQRVSRLALIDGIFPLTATPEQLTRRLADALQAQLNLAGKRRPCYESIERATLARLHGGYPISREAADLLIQRGLQEIPGGYGWRSDPRLTLATPLRLDPEQARALIRAIRVPTQVLVASTGILHDHPDLPLLQAPTLVVEHLPGGHHLHLDDASGAALVAQRLASFLRVSAVSTVAPASAGAHTA